MISGLGIHRVQYWSFSNVSVNIRVSFFRVNLFSGVGSSDGCQCVASRKRSPHWTTRRRECYPIRCGHRGGEWYPIRSGQRRGMLPNTERTEERNATQYGADRGEEWYPIRSGQRRGMITQYAVGTEEGMLPNTKRTEEGNATQYAAGTEEGNATQYEADRGENATQYGAVTWLAERGLQYFPDFHDLKKKKAMEMSWPSRACERRWWTNVLGRMLD
jgi:hypothetical protein